MVNKERTFILNYLNAAYHRAFHEEAAKTQDFLIQLIVFLRYYLNDEIKMVRVKEELEFLWAFFDLYEAGTGRGIIRDLDIATEVEEVDLPAKTLIQMMQELLDVWEETGEETLRVCIEGIWNIDQIVIMFSVRISSPNLWAEKIVFLENQIQKLQWDPTQIHLIIQDDVLRISLKWPAAHLKSETASESTGVGNEDIRCEPKNEG